MAFVSTTDCDSKARDISTFDSAPAETPQHVGRFYVPQLDGLRFLAFLLVFLHHGPRMSALVPPGSFLAKHLRFLETFGWCGVDLFLVLSAFLITSLLLIEYERHGDISLRGFYLRRILRIWPLYYLMSVAGFFILPALSLFAAPWGSAVHTNLLKNHLVPYFTLFGNFSSGRYGYPTGSPIAHLWTVTLEEQFYVVWPLLLCFVLRRWRSAFWILLVALFSGTIAFRLAFARTAPHPFIWTHTLARLDPLVIGVAIAYWRRSHPARGGWIVPTIKIAIGIFVVAQLPAGGPIETQSKDIVWQFLATAAGFGLVLDGVLAPTRNPFARLLALPPFVWLGKLTYGLYIYHVLALHLGDLAVRWGQKWFQLPPAWLLPARSLVSLVLTIAVAGVSFYLFETPFLRLKDRLSRVRSSYSPTRPIPRPGDIL